jgi:hypothetical protein
MRVAAVGPRLALAPAGTVAILLAAETAAVVPDADLTP